ncbi:iron chaperone [Terrabacter sp. 2RAF25]|uniref:iron chaperone n=1 Tax=Terrabacter sp. 2RAF25 TaxID=3232998 RepID=UPI003F9E0112
MGTIGDYLAGLEPEQRAALQRVVDVASRLAPEAEEGTSYGMPALRLDGRPLVGITAAAKHLSVFPFSPAVVEAVAPDLDGFSLSKGTIRFTVDRPVPEAVLERMVALRLAELRR